jgi:CBS domain-containing protein
VALAVLVVGDTTLYTSQLRNRAALPAHRLAFGLPMAAAVSVRSVMAPPRVVLDAAVPAPDAAAQLAAAGVPGAPIVTADGQFVGTVSLTALRAMSERGPTVTVNRLADAEAMTLSPDATLDDAVDAVVTSRAGWVPVLDSAMGVVGVVAVSDLVRGYRLGLRDATRRLARSAPGTALTEREVQAGSPADGATLRELALPHPTIVLSVLRGAELIFADADTALRAGDRLSVLADPSAGPALDRAFGDCDPKS